MTRFQSGIRLFALSVVVAFSGCERRPASADDGTPAAPGNVISCFPDSGPLAFTVNGVPVPEKTVDRFAAFYREMGLAVPDLAKRKAIEEGILTTAAVYSDYRDKGKLEEWTKRVREIGDKLKNGEAFADVAKSSSDCPTKEQGGDLGAPFSRDKNVAALSEAAFSLKAGEVSPPIVSPYGAHFLKVDSRIDGSSPERDQRKASHILVAFDSDELKDATGYREKCQRLLKEARFESVKEPFKKFIPASHRR
jgi:PPIC-type PPIASE domain